MKRKGTSLFGKLTSMQRGGRSYSAPARSGAGIADQLIADDSEESTMAPAFAVARGAEGQWHGGGGGAASSITTTEEDVETTGGGSASESPKNTKLRVRKVGRPLRQPGEDDTTEKVSDSEEKAAAAAAAAAAKKGKKKV